MREWIIFLYHRLQEHLWVRPAIFSLLSIVWVFVAKQAEQLSILTAAPDVSAESIETLLKVIASSMLVMAIFAVGSMVSAYATVSSTATPRAFPLIVADDLSQNALSAFVGAFIFSIVALFALQNGYYERAGRFILLLMTFGVFAMVLLTFVAWVDRIARLGRMATTMEKVETATAAALHRRREAPRLGGISVGARSPQAVAIFSETIGYVQQVNMGALQGLAEKYEIKIEVAALPGTFASPARPVAYAMQTSQDWTEVQQEIACAFVIGEGRTFEEDPRFGLVVLSEIASRALSPAVNDSGTAIAVIGTLVRLLAPWRQPGVGEAEQPRVVYDRVAVPELVIDDLFDDAFASIVRDGATAVEVVVRLQKAFAALSVDACQEMRKAALRHADLTLSCAERALHQKADLDRVRQISQFVRAGGAH